MHNLHAKFDSKKRQKWKTFHAKQFNYAKFGAIFWWLFPWDFRHLFHTGKFHRRPPTLPKWYACGGPRCLSNQKFRKGVGGQRGLAQSLPHHKFLYSAPFFLCPRMSRRTQFWGTFCTVFGYCWSPTPSRQPPCWNLWSKRHKSGLWKRRVAPARGAVRGLGHCIQYMLNREAACIARGWVGTLSRNQDLGSMAELKVTDLRWRT